MRSYLQLVRLPGVFTAMADIFLGFLLSHRAWRDDPQSFGLLLFASACLYMSGMVFNDVFDREIDAQERPNRPIPSGRISVTSATVLGGMLMAAGVGAAMAVGLQSLWIACGLVVCIFAYDGVLKSTVLGPLVMGTCRFLNVMLGASALNLAGFVWSKAHWGVAAPLGLFIVGVTWFSRHEAQVSRRGSLTGAAVVVNLGIAGLIAYVLMVPQATSPQRVALALVFIAVVVDRRLVASVLNPSPENVQSTVKTLLMTLVVLDATMVFYKTGNTVYAAATVALLVPAMLAGRWISVT